jgi:hypothetical protein
MIRRCENPKDPAYAHYGGRGIAVSEEWRSSFARFLADMGLRPTPRHTLERVDNNDGYRAGNVVWATRKEQQNNRRTNRIVRVGTEAKTLALLAEQAGMNAATLRNRLEAGIEPLAAITRPVRRAKPPHRLTDEQVRELRKMVASGVPHRAVASHFATDKSQVSRIAARKARAEVA